MLIKKSKKSAALRIGFLLPVLIAAGLTIGLVQSNTASAQDQPAPPAAISTPAPPPQPAPPPPAQKPQEPVKPAKKAKVEKPTEEDDVFTVVENPPKFPGGEEARVKYLVSEIRYPEEARKKGIQGTVYITYIVEPDGSISNAKILRGAGGGLDEEALRVINKMPKWEPGTQRGKAVRVQFNMPIKFTLSDDGKDKPKK